MEISASACVLHPRDQGPMGYNMVLCGVVGAMSEAADCPSLVWGSDFDALV